jgi:hypothetical protein
VRQLNPNAAKNCVVLVLVIVIDYFPKSEDNDEDENESDSCDQTSRFVKSGRDRRPSFFPAEQVRNVRESLQIMQL